MNQFKGSLREVRGIILRELIKRQKVPKNVLYNVINVTDGRYEKALDELASEGFIVIKNNIVKLAHA